MPVFASQNALEMRWFPDIPTHRSGLWRCLMKLCRWNKSIHIHRVFPPDKLTVSVKNKICVRVWFVCVIYMSQVIWGSPKQAAVAWSVYYWTRARDCCCTIMLMTVDLVQVYTISWGNNVGTWTDRQMCHAIV